MDIVTIILGIMAILLTVIGLAGKITSKVAGKMVSKDECEKTRKHCGELQASNILLSVQKAEYLQHAIDGLQDSSNAQYDMLCAVIIHMPGLTKDDRERILKNQKE